jgi:BirA family biotin operon repressor/biotin-[acetyl-CoA-carboxylase] ligase
MRDKILNLLNNDNFVSGEKLAEKLDVSRTSIWKQIKTLKDLGYRIESVKNKG